MDADIAARIDALDPRRSTAIEISGSAHAGHPWRSYTSVHFPAFDLVAPVDPVEYGTFDVVICEQVLEHVSDPVAAVRTLAALLAPSGTLIVSTPFLVKLHAAPGDFWRFTPDGLVTLLASAGLDATSIRSWGNTWCLRSNVDRWVVFGRRHRMFRRWSLRNDPGIPMVVWASAVHSPNHGN
jgi:SAM-dependent methyltransferase